MFTSPRALPMPCILQHHSIIHTLARASYLDTVALIPVLSTPWYFAHRAILNARPSFHRIMQRVPVVSRFKNMSDYARACWELQDAEKQGRPYCKTWRCKNQTRLVR